MCTVTWIHEEDGYQLFCNRDEKLTRQSALPPRLNVRNGVRFLAPIDGDFAGAWIGTNEFGVSLCILNGMNGSGATTTRSRGLLVLDLIGAPSITSVCDLVQAMNLFEYASFILAGVQPRKPAVLMEWNGVRMTVRFEDAPQFMLTSSSFDSEGVQLSRQEEFHRLSSTQPRSDLLHAFHQSHQPARSAYSICMHRPDAETVSFSWIRVAANDTEFCYTPGAPCERLPGVNLKLRLAAVSDRSSGSS